MRKVDGKFVEESFKEAVPNYSKAVNEIGLWQSEEYIFDKYFKKSGKVLDIGCGTGRTTFGLYKKGYKNIIGLDLSKDMLSAAEKINKKKGYRIRFVQGDATDLIFDEDSFDYALFSFNGLMQIPHKKNRIKALKEIRRVLKKDGIFIFTSHDRDRGEEYREFWKDEKKQWETGKQDQRIHEYGDIMTESDNEEREIYIHIPDRNGVINIIKKSGFNLLEDFYRNDKFDEDERVKKFSGECRFWVVKK